MSNVFSITYHLPMTLSQRPSQIVERQYTAAGIAHVIAQGQIRDWATLNDELTKRPELARDVFDVCENRITEGKATDSAVPRSQLARFRLWRNHLRIRFKVTTRPGS